MLCVLAALDQARAAFSDAFAIERADRGNDDPEEQFALLGMAEDRLLFVFWTLKGDRIRIIYFREAEPHERRRYYNKDRQV